MDKSNRRKGGYLLLELMVWVTISLVLLFFMVSAFRNYQYQQTTIRPHIDGYRQFVLLQQSMEKDIWRGPSVTLAENGIVINEAEYRNSEGAVYRIHENNSYQIASGDIQIDSIGEKKWKVTFHPDSKKEAKQYHLTLPFADE